jgi:RNA polymerase sigma-70 factor, ECF subfamily
MTVNSVNKGEAVDPTSMSLLERVRQNDQDAWSRMAKLYDPLIRYWCLKRGLTADQAEDVTQESLITVSRGIAEFKKEKPSDSFRAWLRSIVNSKVVDLWRSRNRQEHGEGGTEALQRFATVAENVEESAAEVEKEENGILMRRAVELLKTDFQESTWKAFWRTAVDGVPASDVAAELEISVNAVHLAKARVLKRLREEFVHLIRD